jgi:hypothetical protein
MLTCFFIFLVFLCCDLSICQDGYLFHFYMRIFIESRLLLMRAQFLTWWSLAGMSLVTKGIFT